MATSVGSIKVDASLDDAKFSKGLQSMESEASKSSSKLGGVFKKLGSNIGSAVATGLKAATTAVVGLGSAVGAMAVKNTADFEQLAGGMQKIFDEVDYSKIEADAQKAYATMNISANEYMQNLSGVGAIFAQTMGDQTGYDTAVKGMQAIADYSSGTGRSVDELMEKYQMISRSSASYLSIADQFAGILPQTTSDFLKQAKQAGLLSDQYTELTQVPVAEYQKALTGLLEQGVENMGLMGNTAMETEKTVSGSLAGMKSAFENWTVALGSGEGLDEATATLMQTIEAFASNIMPVIGNILTAAIPTLTQTILPQLLNMLTQMLPQLVQGITMVVTQIATALPTILTTLVNAILDPSVVEQLINAALELFMNLLLAIPDVAVALVDALPTIIDALTKPETLARIFDAAVQFFMEIVKALPQILGSLISAFGNLVSNLWSGIVGLFTDIGTKIGDTVSGAIKGVVNGALSLLEGFLNTPIDLINGALDLINKLPGVNVGQIGRISLPRMATGGYVDGYGTSTSDSNMAMLSRGEYVVRADTVRKFGVDFMDALNAGQLPSGSKAGTMITNNYYQFDQQANNRWMYEQLRTGAAA